MTSRCRYILPLLICLSCRLSAQAPSAESLVQQLGAEDYKTRREARRQLQEMGYAAREALAVQLEAEDPEIRQQAQRLWRDLRWYALPDADDDIETIMETLRQGRIDRETWLDFVKRHGVPTVNLLLELATEPRYRAPAQLGLLVYLGELDLLTISQQVVPAVSAQRDEFLALLTSLPTAAGNIFSEISRLQLFNVLGAPEQTIDKGSEAWNSWPTESILLEVLYAMNQGDFRQTLWPRIGQRLYALGDSSERCRQAHFWVVVAIRCSRPDVVAHLLEIADAANADEELLVPLAVYLLENQQYELVLTLTAAADTPALLYLQGKAAALVAARPAVPNAAEWAHVMDLAVEERYCLTLADVVQGDSLTYFEAAVRRVLELKPNRTRNDARAALRLGQLMQSLGDFSAAADYYESGLQFVTDNSPELSRDRPEHLQARIAELRARAADTDPQVIARLRAGYDAQQADDLPQAIAQYQAATALAPDLPQPWDDLYRAQKMDYRFADLPATGSKLLAALGHTFDERLRRAALATELMQTELALKLTGELIAEEPETPQVYLTRASALERAGQFAEAVTDLEQVLALDAYTADAYQSLGLAYAHVGNLAAAARHLERALHFPSSPVQDYLQLWLFCLHQRLGLDTKDRLAVFLAGHPEQARPWEHKLLAFCLGNLSAAQLLAAAGEAGSAGRADGQRCEALFYIGQQLLAAGDQAGAAARFRACCDLNITVFIEWVWAKAELTRLP